MRAACEVAANIAHKTTAVGAIAPEYTAVKPLAIFTFPSSIVHSTKEIKSAADMQGLKFAVSGRIAAEAVTRLGGAPVTMSQTELYPALQRGMVQASNTSWPGAMAWKLEEVTKYQINEWMRQYIPRSDSEKCAYLLRKEAGSIIFHREGIEAAAAFLGDTIAVAQAHYLSDKRPQRGISLKAPRVGLRSAI